MRAAFLTAALALGLLAAPTADAAEAPRCAGRDLSGAPGVTQAKAARADDLLNGDGLLWRIEKPGLPISWLFGTVHSTDADAMAIARRAAGKLSEVKIAATELGAMGSVEKADLAAAMLKAALDHEHDTFDGLPPAERPAVEKMITDLGYPPEFAHRLRLWFLAVLAATPACEAKREALALPEVDAYLADAAQAKGLRVVGLETAADQIDAIASIGPDLSATLLAIAARDPGLNNDIYATLLALYREGRPGDILAVADVVGEMSASERAAEDEFTRRLLIGRNPAMLDRAGPLLSQGAFIAVGALHLSGRDGLVERLRRAGFTVTKAW